MLPQVRLRRHRPGDMGWVVHRHGELYWKEFGYDERFEALVAGIVAGFIEHYDARRERCWIAERAGKRLGAVLLVKQLPRVAKLRLLIVEPDARGLGLGRRLVKACVGFARAAGYRKLVLWTQSELTAARAIYEKLGFRKVRSEPHRSFGKSLVGEYWELKLQGGPLAHPTFSAQPQTRRFRGGSTARAENRASLRGTSSARSRRPPA